MSKQAQRRKRAKLRSELYRQPWAMHPSYLGMLSDAIENRSLTDIQAILSIGRDEDNSITKIVNGIAVIPVTGVLRDEVDFMVRFGMASSYQQIEREFGNALDNEQVKGVMFMIDSPGGSAIGIKRLADEVFESRGVKPIRSYVQGVAASAAYYLAAATDRIDATADSLVGSVGTIMPHTELSGALKEMGVGATVFTNEDSPKKSHGNMFEPLSDAAKATLQNFVNSYGRPFIEDVARYRNLTPDEVIESFGQGDAIRSDVAVRANMVDAIVDNFAESIESMSGQEAQQPSQPNGEDESEPEQSFASQLNSQSTEERDSFSKLLLGA